MRDRLPPDALLGLDSAGFSPEAAGPRSEYYIPVVVERTGRGERVDRVGGAEQQHIRAVGQHDEGDDLARSGGLELAGEQQTRVGRAGVADRRGAGVGEQRAGALLLAKVRLPPIGRRRSRLAANAGSG